MNFTPRIALPCFPQIQKPMIWKDCSEPPSKFYQRFLSITRFLLAYISAVYLHRVFLLHSSPASVVFSPKKSLRSVCVCCRALCFAGVHPPALGASVLGGDAPSVAWGGTFGTDPGKVGCSQVHPAVLTRAEPLWLIAIQFGMRSQRRSHTYRMAGG